MLVNPWPNDFPDLMKTGFKETSPFDTSHNCIAYAAGDKSQQWWPDPWGLGFWPDGVVREPTLTAFSAAFATLGYKETPDSKYDPNYDRVAIYALGDTVQHAAIQLGENSWSSKLGDDKDISHALAGLEGPTYGRAVMFLSRKRKNTAGK